MNRAEAMSDEIARWKSSGLSLMAYSRQSAVSYQKLLYWRSKLAAKSARKSSPATTEPTLVPVRVVDHSPSTSAAPAAFEVWLANGVALNVTTGFDERELRRLVDVLSAC